MENDLNDEKLYKKSLYAVAASAIIAAVIFMGQFFFEDSGEIQTENEEIEDIQAEYEEMSDIQTEEVQEVSSENNDTDMEIDEGDEILRRFQSIDWEKVRPRTYMEDSDWYTNVFCLGSLPENDINMYGYNDADYHDRGVAITIGDSIYYFDWGYFSPRQILPQMYWNDADKQLQITLCHFTGTGVQAEELHVLQLSEENELEDYVFANGSYDSLLSVRIGFSYEKDTHMITFYDNQDNRELMQADLSWIEEKEVEELVFGDIGHFQLGDEIYLIFTPGYMVEGWATPQYDEIPEIAAQVQLEISNNQIVFGLGEIDLVGDEE